jgi:16S rRNA (guanine527-N7)-methyltransferase
METGRIAELLAPFLPQALEAGQLTAVGKHLDLLLRWNQRINLTAVRDPEQIVSRHFGESLFAAAQLFPRSATSEHRVIDVGSGAGFPGIPIRIYAPVALTLIESRQRKAIFLREVARALDFTDIEVFAGRAEDYPPQSPARSLTVTLRAVERFEQAITTAAHLLRSGQRLSAGDQRRLALLIGEGQVDTARGLEPQFAWAEPVPIPQSRSRVLLLGELL